MAGPGRVDLGAAEPNSPVNLSRLTGTGLRIFIVKSPDKSSGFTTMLQAIPVSLGIVARLDPAGPPDDGAPAACARWAFVAGPARVDLGAAEPNSPEKSSCFTTMPRSVGVWLWIPPVDCCALPELCIAECVRQWRS